MSVLSALVTPTNIATGTNALSMSNKTLLNPAVTDFVETAFNAGSTTALTVNLSNGTVQRVSASGSGITITLPASVAGKSFIVILTYTGSQTVTWAGGGTLRWVNGATPTATSVSGKADIFSFFQDGTNTFGSVFGANF
jgi:hypothetical protein